MPPFGLLTGSAALGSLLCAATLVAPGQGQSQDPPTFAADVELVQIDVVVLDREGRPVTGLEEGDFEVVDEGRSREILTFEPVVVRGGERPSEEPLAVSAPHAHDPSEGRYIVVFFDDHHLSPAMAERARRAVGPFLARELRDGDAVTVVAPASELWWTARTAWEHRQLEEVAARVAGHLARDPFGYGRSEWMAMREVEFRSRPYASGAGAASREGSDGAQTLAGSMGQGNFWMLEAKAQETYDVALQRMRKSLGTLEDVLERLRQVRGRKTVLFVSEGFVRSPRSQEALERVIERARRANVVVELVDPRGLRSGLMQGDASRTEFTGNSLDGFRSPSMALQTEAGGAHFVAAATGGRVLLSNDVAAVVRDVVQESDAYYLLGYALPEGKPGERRVRVRLRGEGLTVRARERYFVGAVKEERPQGRRSAEQALRGPVGADGLSLRVSTLYAEATADGRVSTALAVEIDPVPGESRKRRLRLLAEAQPIAGGEAHHDAADLALEATGQPRVATRKWSLAPGVWQVRVVVEEPAAGRVGSVVHTFEVPVPVGLRLGVAVLGDPLPDGGAAPRLSRRYRQEDTLLARFDVFGATPDPATGSADVVGSSAIVQGERVLRRYDASRIEPRDDGFLTRTLTVPLARLEPGSYALRFEVHDTVSGQHRERMEPFEIVRD
jgi:VWFA-related protein